MNLESLRVPEEKTRFLILTIASALLAGGLVIATFGMALLWVLVIAIVVVAARSTFLARIRGNAVKITDKQFPELHARIADLSKRMGLATPPDAYVMQAEGALNAFATRLLGRNFIVLYSDLLEACPEGEDGGLGKEAEAIVAHELGHLALGHLKWSPFLIPGRLLPLVGAAYSRACERSCDRIGLEAVGDLNTAIRALTILAAGKRYGLRTDPAEYVRQQDELSSYYPSLVELASSHPFLVKRVAHLMNARNPGSVPIARRHKLAYLFAPLSGLSGGGGGGLAGIMVFVAAIGIIAAIAIPRFAQMKQQAVAAQNMAQQQAELERRMQEEALRQAEEPQSPSGTAVQDPAAAPSQAPADPPPPPSDKP